VGQVAGDRGHQLAIGHVGQIFVELAVRRINLGVRSAYLQKFS
jgi:hypothetical protein